MGETYNLRTRLLNIARRDSNKIEESRNRAPWIEKLWKATSSSEFYQKGNKAYPNGDPPYCAAGISYCLREWLKDNEVLSVLNLTVDSSEQWRCKSPVAFDWINWAKSKGLSVLPKNSILHAADIVIYEHSHIEFVSDDDNTTGGPFIAIGYNTNASGSRDGEGCFEKPRSREKVKAFIRILK